MNQLFVGIDVGSRGNTAYLMRPDGDKHSNFTVQNTQGGAKILIDKIVSALTTMGLEQVVIGMEATGIYGENLVYALREDGTLAGSGARSMCSIPSRSASSRNPTPTCPRTMMWTLL